MRTLIAATFMLAAGVLATIAAAPMPPPSGSPAVHGIVMVDFAFQPARLAARQGDVLQFVQKGDQPHNVQFTRTPKGVDLGAAAMGTFLVQKGTHYELRIDGRFKPGTYDFVCTPHKGMGMKGVLTVLPADG